MIPKHLGPTQIAILRTASGGRGFVAVRPTQYQAALKLNAQGLIDRDLRRGHSRRFVGNEAGTRFIQEHDADLARRAGLE